MAISLQQVAAAYGIQRRYTAFDSTTASASNAAVTGLLKALGIATDDPAELSRALAQRPRPAAGGMHVPPRARCYLPEFLAREGAWGVTCQVYALRSRRNWGIGDLEDLARLGEVLASFGADFVGVNPLHALFLAAPERASPFFPSDRRFLNPLLIAVDQIDGYDESDGDAAELRDLRDSPLVAYRRVADVKLAALRRIYRRQQERGFAAEFETFRKAGGAALRQHALFLAISRAMAKTGKGAGWLAWPEEFQDPNSAAVLAFAREHEDEISYQIWLQWLVDRQLAGVARRLKAAGMRIGPYLDLAVGTAPDGSATWRDRSLTVVDVEIGAPPDLFNPAGQNWGLAPLAPSELMARNLDPIRRSYAAALRHAGALRIDHAMSLHRLFWIPKGFPASDGAYALYPMAELVAALAEASQQHRAIIIGEDLGVVPAGFRSCMARAGILGYRLFFFERTKRGFRRPQTYPSSALACIGSHDTATLAGWWTGADIDTREEIGLLDAAGAADARAERKREHRAVLALLARQDLSASGPGFSPELAAAIHRLVARARSHLFAAQLEDLVGMPDQVNVPGTLDEHPNWRRKIPVDVEDLAGHPFAARILCAIAEERPRRS